MRKLLCIMMVLFLVGAPSVVFAGVIDTFDVGGLAKTESENLNPANVESGLATTDVFDGQRSTDIVQTGQGSSVSVNNAGDGTTGVCSFSNDDQAQHTLKLNYTTTSAPSVDLTDGGTSDRVRFSFTNDDQPFDLYLEVAGTGGSGSHTATNVAAGTPTVDILFSDLGAADVANATDVEILLTPTTVFGGDYRFDLIESTSPPNGNVPEPAGLLGLGLLALVGRKRRS